MFRKAFILVALVFLALLITDCGASASEATTISLKTGEELSHNSSSNAANCRTAQALMHITTYQATKDAMHLVPEIHVVPKNKDIAKTALELLTAGSNNPARISVLPPGTKVLSVSIRNHIAYADFNDKLIKNNPGGSTEELLLVTAIVDTLTEFSEIKKVLIFVNGKKMDTITGHVDTSEPLLRSTIASNPLSN